MDLQKEILERQVNLMESDKRIYDLNDKIKLATDSLGAKLDALDNAKRGLQNITIEYAAAKQKYEDLINKLSQVKH